MSLFRSLCRIALPIVLAAPSAPYFFPGIAGQGATSPGTTALSLTPSKPRSGSRITVAYRPIATLAKEDSLILRGHFRTVPDPMYNGALRKIRLATLRPDRGGVFRGSFKLPDSAVYVALAVENGVGNRVDSNNGRPWEALVHSAKGQPLYAALDQRANDYSGRDWMEAYRSMREAMRLYPDSLRGWGMLLFYEGQVIGGAASDSLNKLHQARMAGFHRRFAKRALTPAQIADIYQYASRIGDSAVKAFWTARLLAEAPRTRAVAQLNGIAALTQYYKTRDAVAGLAAMERHWKDAAGTGSQLPGWALRIAVAARDTVAVNSWLERIKSDQGYLGIGIAGDIESLPSHQDRALEILRAELSAQERPDDSRRPLDRTVTTHEKDALERRARLLNQLGSMLVKAGKTQAGIDTLKLAAAAVLDPELFSTLGNAELAVGDTAGAIRSLAMVAADAGTSPARQDSLRARVGLPTDAPEWVAAVDSAKIRLVPRVLADTVRWKPKPSELATSGGGVKSLSSIVAGKPTVVVFWNRNCGPCILEMPAVQKLYQDLQRIGVGLISVTDDSPSDSLSKFIASKGVTYPVYYDVKREASLAFNISAIPAHFVLDETGEVRFALSPLDRLAQQIAALRSMRSERP
jgi:peroxiredoxin